LIVSAKVLKNLKKTGKNAIFSNFEVNSGVVDLKIFKSRRTTVVFVMMFEIFKASRPNQFLLLKFPPYKNEPAYEFHTRKPMHIAFPWNPP
jgi:hypothetical protein